MDHPTAELLAHHIWKTPEAAGLDVACVRSWETDASMVEVRSG